jgi:hypothetical protein
MDEPLSWAERGSAVLGIVFGVFVIWISVDLLTGGLLSRRRTPASEEVPGDSDS